MTATAEAVSAGSVQYNDDQVQLTSRDDVNKEKTRYVFSIGDHISEADKEGFKSIGGHFGGLWVGHSETEGCPTMKRTNFMLYRGAITPLETTAIGRKADHREVNRNTEGFLTGPGVPPGVRGYTVYASNDLNFLQSDKYRPLGVVELQALQFKGWKESNAAQLQLLLFPRWNDWLRGVKAPVLVDDWMAEIRRAFQAYPDLLVFQNDMANSERLFKNYANSHIERNRQQIMSKRSVDNGGMFVGWSGTSRLYAKQLGTVLENEDQLRPAGSNVATGDPAIIEEMRRDRELRQQETQNMTKMIQMMAGLLAEKGVSVERYADEFTEPDQVEVVHDDQVIDETPEDLAQYVGTATPVVEAPEEVNLVTQPAAPVNTKKNKKRDRLEAKLEDPAFARAVDEDPGLRAQIKSDPELAGAIEEDTED